MVIVQENGIGDRGKQLDEDICVTLHVNSQCNGQDPSALPSNYE